MEQLRTIAPKQQNQTTINKISKKNNNTYMKISDEKAKMCSYQFEKSPRKKFYII